jgi:endo-1,4-beta-xylanase
MFAKEKLDFTITPSDATNKKVIWTSSAPSVVSVTSNGTVKALSYITGGTETGSSAATGTAVITAKTEDGGFKATITVTTTMAGQVDMMTLPPLKDQFSNYFLIGNITRSSGDYSGEAITNTRLTRHFNVLTAENHMKPDAYGGSRSGTTVSGLTYTNSDAFVNAATASGFKVHAHVLLWHSQNSGWISSLSASTGKETALGAMKDYITKVMTHYKDKIYSWDVLNEVFPDNIGANADWKTAMRTNNPWFASIGSDFVFEGFKAARQADPDAILYYNDYNLDNANKAGATHRMVRDVNQQWTSDPLYDGRKLIEGIGMQSHHNTGVSAANISTSLNLFKQLGVKISISEIDVLSQGWSDYDKVTPTNAGKLQAANLYGEYFKLFLQNSDIIERVTFWGVYDEQSWRSGGRPLIFEGSSTSKAKPAYYKIIEALEGR